MGKLAEEIGKLNEAKEKKPGILQGLVAMAGCFKKPKGEKRKECLSLVVRETIGAVMKQILDKALGWVFDKLIDLLWSFVDKPIDALKAAIVGALGTIPFVGGFLATLASQGLDMLH